jgi:hypothetical protein
VASALLIVASACGLYLGGHEEAVTPGAPSAQVILVSPMVKVAEAGPIPDPPSGIADLNTPRGGTALLQLVVRGGSSGVRGLRAQVHAPSPLVVDLYREAYVTLTTPSNSEGAAGAWPDPLIPTIDPFDRQARNAFPVDVAAGQNQPVWVEIFVPPDTLPGRYQGTMTLTGDGLGDTDVPFDVRVRDVSVPRTSTLPVVFGFSAISAMQAHYGGYRSDDDGIELYHRYAALALRDRITLGGGLMAPPDYQVATGGVRVKWDRYDTEMGPVLDGTLPAARGAHGTYVDIRWPAPGRLPASALPAYLAAWRAHFSHKGWLSRLYDYTWDEPRETDYPAVLERATLDEQALPEVPRLVTSSVVPGLDSAVNLFTPLVNCIDPRPPEHGDGRQGDDDFAPPACGPDVIARLHARGERVFFYQSCESHGCDEVGNGYFTGWPSYVIDASPLSARVMGWIAYRFGLDGQLYYNTVEAYNDGDAWVSINRHGGNGDGTLFYPGTPKRVGGTTDIPISSLRLSYIGQGLEDYELLAMARRLGGKAAAVADAEAKRLVPHAYAWDHDPADFVQARETLLEAIEASTSPAH